MFTNFFITAKGLIRKPTLLMFFGVSNRIYPIGQSPVNLTLFPAIYRARGRCREILFSYIPIITTRPKIAFYANSAVDIVECASELSGIGSAQYRALVEIRLHSKSDYVVIFRV